MESSDLNIRAAIFDVYGTLLEIGLPPGNADEAWPKLLRETLPTAAALSHMDFAVATNRVITQLHESARANGIPHPEVQWPSVVAKVIPEVARLESGQREEFIFRQMQLGHSTRLADGVADTLRFLAGRACVLGIASNAQAYTLRELKEALAAGGGDFRWFDPELCFWSFQHGFSKPDPHVFQLLTARLEGRGIGPGETLMIGDRLDNDLEPARRAGWRAWHLAASASPPDGGGWAAFRAWIAPRLRSPK